MVKSVHGMFFWICKKVIHCSTGTVTTATSAAATNILCLLNFFLSAMQEMKG